MTDSTRRRDVPPDRALLAIAALGAACALWPARARAASIAYSDFSSVAGLTINGNASQQGTRLQITPNSGNQAGSAYVTDRFQFVPDYSFNLYFAATMPATGGSNDVDGQGADGMAFVIQNVGANALGASGGAMAFSGLAGPFAAVALDTYHSGAFDPAGNNGVNGNHVEVDLSGQATSILQSGPHTAGGTPNNPPRFQGAKILETWVDYDGATDVMSIYHAQSPSGGAAKPASPLVTGTVDLATHFGTRPDGLFVGFAGGTGGATTQQQVLAFSLSSVPEPTALAALALPAGAGLLRRRRRGHHRNRRS